MKIHQVFSAVALSAALAQSPVQALTQFTHDELVQICLNPDFAEKVGYGEDCVEINNELNTKRVVAGVSVIGGAAGAAGLLAGGIAFYKSRKRRKKDSSESDTADSFFDELAPLSDKETWSKIDNPPIGGDVGDSPLEAEVETLEQEATRKLL